MLAQHYQDHLRQGITHPANSRHSHLVVVKSVRLMMFCLKWRGCLETVVKPEGGSGSLFNVQKYQDKKSLERYTMKLTPNYYVTVTGGEPLAQPACLPLLTALCDQGYCVSIETSGALDISPIDPRVIKVMDIKTPGSGEVDRNRHENIAQLSERDQLKFVLCDRLDYDWAKQLIKEHALLSRCEILFSPSYEQIALSTLADWIVADRLPVRLQCQLHKLIWGDKAGC